MCTSLLQLPHMWMAACFPPEFIADEDGCFLLALYATCIYVAAKVGRLAADAWLC